MNGAAETQELDLLLEVASRQAVHRLRGVIAHPDQEADPLDVLIVSDYRRRVLEGQSLGPWAMLKKSGPAAAGGGVIVSLLLAGIQALGQIFGR